MFSIMVKHSWSVGLTMTSLLLLALLRVAFMQAQQEHLHHNPVCSTLVGSGMEKIKP